MLEYKHFACLNSLNLHVFLIVQKANKLYKQIYDKLPKYSLVHPNNWIQLL